jgi:hypothetical protein
MECKPSRLDLEQIHSIASDYFSNLFLGGMMNLEKSYINNVVLLNHIPDRALSNGVGLGLIGGLAGTMVMDLVLMAALFLVGMPALTCFTIVGETIAKLLSWQRTNNSTITQLGLEIHYTIGPIVGMIFGLLVVRWKSLRINSLQKSILFAVVYIEILSQPLLAAPPLLLKMSLSTILLWYGGSTLMHLIAGVVLGTVVYRGVHIPK